eukprot:995307-Rhodomonas_salina.1
MSWSAAEAACLPRLNWQRCARNSSSARDLRLQTPRRPRQMLPLIARSGIVKLCTRPGLPRTMMMGLRSTRARATLQASASLLPS